MVFTFVTIFFLVSNYKGLDEENGELEAEAKEKRVLEAKLNSIDECPYAGQYTITTSGFVFTFPRSGQKISTNTMCTWYVDNSNRGFMKFYIRRTSVILCMLFLGL